MASPKHTPPHPSRNCLDCGAGISHRGSRAKRCEPCAYQKAKDDARQWALADPERRKAVHNKSATKNREKDNRRRRERYWEDSEAARARCRDQYAKTGKQVAHEHYVRNADAYKAKAREWELKNPGRRKSIRDKSATKNREKKNERARARYWADPDATRAQGRERYKRTGHLAMKAHYERNKDAYKARAYEWREANPERRRELSSRYRARQLDQKGDVSPDIVGSLMERQAGKCVAPRCGVSLAKGYHLDHIIPLSKGGMHDDSNLQLLCPHCNISKHAQMPEDFARRRGMLV